MCIWEADTADFSLLQTMRISFCRFFCSFWPMTHGKWALKINLNLWKDICKNIHSYLPALRIFPYWIVIWISALIQYDMLWDSSPRLHIAWVVMILCPLYACISIPGELLLEVIFSLGLVNSLCRISVGLTFHCILIRPRNGHSQRHCIRAQRPSVTGLLPLW